MIQFFNQLSELVKTWLIFCILFLILLASSYALLHPSFFHLHDFTHAARIAEMVRGLDAGQLPVRWSENFGYGFGMPLFNFYAPLPYFVGALFYKVGFSLLASIKLLYLLTGALTIISSYLLGRQLLGRLGGLVLAAAYTLAPYRALNLFVRGALSEALAMSFLPVVLWAIVAFSKKQDKKYLFFLVLSLFGIILSHNLTALIFIPLAALFTFLYLWRLDRLKLLWPIAGQFILAAALSAFYMLPALLEKNDTVIERIFAGYFHYSHHFLYLRQFFQDNWAYGGSGWGPGDDVSFFLGFGQLSGLLVLMVLLLGKLRRGLLTLTRRKEFFLLVTIGLMLIFSLLMSTFKTQWLWDRVSLLQFIQFPWRFLSAASLFVAILVAFNFAWLRGFGKRLILALILLVLLFTNARYFQPEKYLDNAAALYYGEPERIRNEMSEILPDYIPKQMPEEKVLREKNQELPALWLNNEMYTKNDDDKLEIMLDRGFEKMALIDSGQEQILNFKVAYFPGWQAEVDGQSQEILVSESLGNIQVRVPKGEHKVVIYFSEQTPARIWGDAISLLALLICFYYFAPFAKNKK